LSSLAQTLRVSKELNIPKETYILNCENTIKKDFDFIDRTINSDEIKNNFKKLTNNKFKWKKNFNNIILNDYKQQYISELEDLKNNNLPSYLYKYKEFSEHSISNLINDTIWLSNPKDFNDPYDCTFTINLDINGNKLIENNIESYPNDIKKIILEKIELTKQHLEKKISIEKNIKYKKSLKVFSLSENKDSILMWSHYADSHKGFCIEYETIKLGYKNIKFIYPLVYSNKIIDITKYKFNSFSPILNSLIKFDIWKYENEWRLVFPSNFYSET
jgi:hypothetical protein